MKKCIIIFTFALDLLPQFSNKEIVLNGVSEVLAQGASEGEMYPWMMVKFYLTVFLNKPTF